MQRLCAICALDLGIWCIYMDMVSNIVWRITLKALIVSCNVFFPCKLFKIIVFLIFLSTSFISKSFRLHVILFRSMYSIYEGTHCFLFHPFRIQISNVSGADFQNTFSSNHEFASSVVCMTGRVSQVCVWSLARRCFYQSIDFCILHMPLFIAALINCSSPAPRY